MLRGHTLRLKNDRDVSLQPLQKKRAPDGAPAQRATHLAVSLADLNRRSDEVSFARSTLTGSRGMQQSGKARNLCAPYSNRCLMQDSTLRSQPKTLAIFGRALAIFQVNQRFALVMSCASR